MPVPDLRAIAAHYGGEVSGRECLIPTPGHGRQDRGTAIRLAPGASDGVTVHCFNGEWREAKDMLRRDGFLPASGDARPRELTSAEREKLRREEAAARYRKEEVARELWEQAAPAAGSLAERYLRGRGISPPYPPSLRCTVLPCANAGLFPALVCAVTDRTGRLTGVQRIFLAADGSGKADMPQPKRSLGRVAGGAIRFGKLGRGDTLTVTEGPEDGLTLWKAGLSPVWVAGGAAMLPAMLFPPQVRTVLIGADADPAGREQARKAADAFTAHGLEVRIVWPAPGHKDFNAELQEARHGRSA